MSVSIKEKVLKYYPKYWDINKIDNLKNKGLLTAEEYNEITQPVEATLEDVIESN